MSILPVPVKQWRNTRAAPADTTHGKEGVDSFIASISNRFPNRGISSVLVCEKGGVSLESEN